MKGKIRYGLLLLVIVGAAYMAGRTRSLPVPPYLDAPFDPVALGLEGRRASFRFTDEPLKDVIQGLGKAYQADIHVDWASFEEDDWPTRAGAPATLHATERELHEVLDDLNLSVDGGVSWTVSGRQITVMSRRDAAVHTVTRFYDLRPLYSAIYGREMPVFAREGASASEVANSQNFGGGLFGASDPPPPLVDVIPGEAQFAGFVARVAHFVADRPEDERGDQVRTFEAGGTLIVTADAYGHVRLARFLNWLATRRSGDSLKSYLLDGHVP